ncbi:MAG: YbjN domain-containing protein [Propionibacteriaceae bacterium]|jgi:hypothetical protein|nr:YbjN domain-containing protein [Propionibacteriaceae bacterium]
MGFFDQTSGDAATLAPLSRERIEAVFQKKEWRYQVDSDGDLGGIWDDNLFYFFTAGERKEILYIRGRWHHALSIDQRNEAREVIDSWHLDRLWPKGYTRVDDDGQVRIFAELVVDFENGVTDGQLTQTVMCGISTSIQLFEHLANHFGKG